MEYIDVYDETMSVIGNMSKAEAHRIGAWHKSIHCWIVRRDSTGEYIVFQKRSATKSTFPNYLDISAAGHYQMGERLEDGVREITEELGINISFRDLLYLGMKFDIYKDKTLYNREFCETFLYRDDRRLTDYPIDCNEVTGLVEVRIQDGLDLFSEKTDFVKAWGIEYVQEKGQIEELELNVNRDMFIHRNDPYYGKIFMISKAYFKGERQLFI